MALIEMDFAGSSGEKFTETVLWTNPNPTALLGAGTINLSQDVTNFDYICCEFYYSTSNQSKLMKTMISVDSLQISTGSYPDVRLTIGAFLDSSNFMRAISIQQNTAYIYDNVVGGAYDAYTIPYRILGLK